MSARAVLRVLALATVLAFLFGLAAGLAGCGPRIEAPIMPAEWRAAHPDHNQYGGYIPACGELPPLIGDDC